MTSTLLEPHAETISPRALARQRDHWFYTAMGIVALLVAIIGFNASFRGALTGSKTFTRLVHIHGALFGSWLLFFIVQTRLIATGRVAIHRRLGIAGGLLALTMLGVGYRTSIVAARHGYDLSGAHDPLGFLVFPLGDLTSFAVLVGAALWYRKRPMAHKRLMLLATVGAMLNAPLAHLVATTPALFAIKAPIILIPMIALFFASAVYDRITLGRMHPVSLWGGIALLVWANLRAGLIGSSAPWHAFAGWLVS